MRKLMLQMLILALAACGAGGSRAGMPTAVLSADEIEQLESEAAAFAEQHLAAWPDVDAYIADLAEDVGFADPTWGDLSSGRQGLVATLREWEAWTDYTIDVGAMYLSADGVAYEESWPGLQPPMPLPPDPPVASGLEVYRFGNGETVSIDLWYLAEDNVAYGIGCFAVDGCPAFQDTVERYIAAWSSRGPDAIAALYSDDALFVDSLLGLEAKGADDIGDLAEERFGSAGNLTIEVLGLYAWTDGRIPPSDAAPDRGQIIGVAIHYRTSLDTNGITEIQEGVTTLELGSRDETSFEADPEGLIHHEDVYHEPTSLLAGIKP